jgi:hypothetical protein
MGVAYSVKKGDMQLSEVDADYRDQVQQLVDGMTLKQLKDFASTSHSGLPETREALTVQNIGGMGPVVLPTTSQTGSGDIPAGQGDAEEEYKKKRKKMKYLLNFESFVNESTDLSDVSEKKWFNNREKWEKERNKLDVSDDDLNWTKDDNGKLNSFWYEDRNEGWIQGN